jgi:hypothetical protein
MMKPRSKLLYTQALTAFTVLFALGTACAPVDPSQSQPATTPTNGYTQPTLDLYAPTPTPEILPPPGGDLPLVTDMARPLSTTPYRVELGSGRSAEFYPAGQESVPASLLLLPASEESRAILATLAQTAQVHGLDALLLDPSPSAEDAQAGLSWSETNSAGGLYIVADREAAAPALQAALENSGVRGVALLTPSGDTSALQKAYGSRPLLTVEATGVEAISQIIEWVLSMGQ